MLKKGIFLFLFIILFQSVSASVRITEVMYNPETCDNNFCEWIEIYNSGEESIDLSDWKLCDKELLKGYIDTEGIIYSETTTILPSKNYAIITDGGSGTETYDNFNINPSAIALHVSTSSLCGGLNNKGDLIILKDSSGNTADSVSYDGSSADGDGNSLQLCNDLWLAGIPTSGLENCPAEETEDEEEVPEKQMTEEIENEETAENIDEETDESNEDIKESEILEYEEVKENISDNISPEENKEEITGESVSDIIYESKSEKLKDNSIYLFSFVLLLAIFYTLLKKKA